MERYTPEQRRQYADLVCDLVNEWIVQKQSDFEIDFERGVEWCTHAATGERTPRANPTFSVTLRINGGAQPTEGRAIVPAPPVFRGPTGGA